MWDEMTNTSAPLSATLGPGTGDDPLASASRSAAVWVWAVGALEVLFSGCLMASVAATSALPRQRLVDELRRQNWSPQQIDQIHVLYPLLWAVAVVIFFCGVVPGLAYLAMGFGVRAGRMGWVTACLALTVTQSLVLGVLLLTHLAGAVFSGDPGALTAGALVFGSPLALLGAVVYRLLIVSRHRREHLDLQTDPWRPVNDPLFGPDT
jgi:hypothetical protein